ncbi:MAG TPA: cyclic nucleotide-binding domain-containing protein [Candidatus Limnocylindrales bacterium]|nr:cyclic nucleotide-binding domain-containing protein [Candidatus Limnocylindrales bacterium]
MAPSLARRLEPSFDALRRVATNGGLLRLQLASFLWSAAEACYLVGLFVLAHVVGGTTAVALVAVLRALPSVVLAPLALSLADGLARDRLLRLVVLARLACVGLATALVLASGPLAALYALAAVDAVAAALLRPIRVTLVPALARSPEELVAANVATSTGDSLAGLIGPGIAALLLVAGDVPATFVAGTLTMGVALASTLGVHAGGAIQTGGGPAAASRARRASPVTAARDLFALRHARLIVALFAAQRFVRGMLTVLVVAAAFDVLGMGDAGVGVLTSAVGLGGLVGGAVALSLVGRQRLAVAFLAGLVAWGGGILLAGVVPAVAVVVAFLAVAGIGKVVLDVAGFSLLQRTVPTDRRGRVFGLLEGIVTAALAFGPVAASLLVDGLGAPAALVVAGAIPIVLVAIAWPVLSSADDAAVVPERELRLLDSVAMFKPLQLTTIEQLAEGLRRQPVAAGSDVVRQGEAGDTFYIVESGRLEALVDGRVTTQLGPGDSFGEIALLRDVPRTATVRALEPSLVMTLAREPFLAAVASHGESIAAADEVVRTRLAGA